MSTRSASWSRPAERASVALAAVCAAGAFATSWGLLHLPVYAHAQIRDTPVYRTYGEAVVHGEVPYRDFGVEYPPGALPVFVLPAVGSPSEHGYRTRFDLLMLVCGIGAVAAVAAALGALGAGSIRLLWVLGLTAVVMIYVLNHWPEWGWFRRYATVAGVLVGSYKAPDIWLKNKVNKRSKEIRKGLPDALDLLVICAEAGLTVDAAFGRVARELGKAYPELGDEFGLTAIGLVVTAAIFAPFVALAPGGVRDAVVNQTTRPLQIESLGSAVLVAAHHLFGFGLRLDSSHGSQNLGGSLPDAAGAAESALVLAGLTALWLWFARRPRDTETLVRASAAAVCLFVAFGKVLSPQYMIWLIPLVPLVRGRRGLAAGGLFALALVLTQLWFPDRYWNLVYGFGGYESTLVLARDLVLLALLGVLIWPPQTSTRTA